MKEFLITTDINDGEYEHHTYIEAESIKQIDTNSILVNNSIKIMFGGGILSIGPE